jgi:hypothetical protein
VRPILASNFDSLGLIFVAGFILLCLLIGAGGAVFRNRGLQICAAIACLSVGALTFWAFHSFSSDDRLFAGAVGAAGLVLGAGFMVLSFVRKK